MNRSLFASSLSIVTSLAIAASPLGATASAARIVVVAPEQPGPPTSDTEDPLADLSTPEPDEAPVGSGPVVHIVNELPDEDRGLLKLARYVGTSTQAGDNVLVITTNYEELCTEPCGITVDVTDRPRLFFVRDGEPVSYAFRLKNEPEVTLSVRPLRDAMHTAGFYLTVFFIYPAGLPLLLLGRSKVSIAAGPPAPGQSFTKLKKAKR